MREERILRKYYRRERAKGIKKRIPYRTQNSISSKARRMGMRVAFYTYQSSGKKWSTRELNILEKFYAIEGTACIKRLPGRSRNAIIAMVQQQGLTVKETTAWSEEENDIIKQNPDLDNNTLQTLLPNRTMNAIEKQRKRLGVEAQKSAKFWTPEEDAILRQYYPTEAKACQKRLPNRSRMAIHSRARVLKLSFIQKPTLWSAKEDAILRQYYPTEGIYCQKYLPNRSRTAIKGRATLLGIYRDTSWSQEENDLLKKNCGIEIEQLRQLLSGRSQKGIIKQMKHLEACGELTIPRKTKPWTPEEDAILQQYYPTEAKACQKRLPNRSRIAIYKRARSLGLTVL